MENLKTNTRYGINIKKYCAKHEAYIQMCLDSGKDPAALLALHALKIGWLQHERLVHLIVVFIFSVLFLFSVGLAVASVNPYALILTAVSLALLAAYIRHYFILENKVQYWYTLYDEIYGRLHDKNGNSSS